MFWFILLQLTLENKKKIKKNKIYIESFSDMMGKILNDTENKW